MKVDEACKKLEEIFGKSGINTAQLDIQKIVKMVKKEGITS